MKKTEEFIDNRREVFKTYIWVMGLTALFIAAQFPLFYFPTLYRSYSALEHIKQSEIIDLGELHSSDAVFYGSFLQSAAGMGEKSSWSFSFWMIVTYGLVVLMAYATERYYALQFKGKSFYQDLTLEFKHLSDQYGDEESILKLFQVLSSGNVREISLLYDMSDYFRLTRNLEKYEVELSHSGSLKER